MLLNTGFSSPQAWLWLATARGYLAEEGIALDLTQGAGRTPQPNGWRMVRSTWPTAM
ncbi:MAG: hypothetical protein MUF08_00705 [Burkholderiaceae bacterium]|jgi:hypothetical protein|nr:hypothetical protein [Burkholderiaceae bacterium]